jgi:hypothetical protein
VIVPGLYVFASSATQAATSSAVIVPGSRSPKVAHAGPRSSQGGLAFVASLGRNEARMRDEIG